MITRESRKLSGPVRKVETEFAVFETVDGKLTETGNHPSGYEIFDTDGKLLEDGSEYRLVVQDAYRHVYFYDEAGELDFREEFDENDAPVAKTIFERSEDGKLVEKHYYFDREGKLKLGYHSIYEGDRINDSEAHDQENLVVEVAHYDENEKIIPRHSKRYEPFDQIRRNTIEYEDGYAIEEFRANERGEFSLRVKTVHDADGNVKEHFCYEPDGTLYLQDEYVYRYDRHGNWIEQIQKHWVIGWGEFKLTPLSVARRKIEYFEEF